MFKRILNAVFWIATVLIIVHTLGNPIHHRNPIPVEVNQVMVSPGV